MSASSLLVRQNIARVSTLLCLCVLFSAPALHAQVVRSAAVVPLGSGFVAPSAMAVDASGDVFVADNNNVYEIVAVNGVVSSTSTVNTVGSGFSNPWGVAVDSSGDVFVADFGNVAVYEIVAGTNGNAAGTVSSTSTVNTVGSGFHAPTAVAVDSAGNVFVADYGVAVSAVDWIVEGTNGNAAGMVSSTSTVTAVGSGFSNPLGVAVDRIGNVFVADTGNSAVKEIVAINTGKQSGQRQVSSTSPVNTVGSGFINPTGVAVDGSGNVFVSDLSNSAVYDIVAGTNGDAAGIVSSASTVNTMAGGFSAPHGVAVDGNGDVFVADSGNAAAKEIETGALTFPATAVNSPSASIATYFTFPNGGILAATPYVVLTQGAPGKDFQVSGSQLANACVTGQTYNAGDVCTVNLTFTPTLPYQRIGAVQVQFQASLRSQEQIATLNLRGVGTGPQVVFPSNSAVAMLAGSFNLPRGVAVDGNGDVFAADASGAVYEVVAVNGTVSSSSTVNTVGSGFSSPSNVAVDSSGDVFVADYGNNAVYEIVAGTSGNAAGAVSSTSQVIQVGSGFLHLFGVAVDSSGDVFVADAGNGAVKEVVAGTNGNAPGAVSSASAVNAVGSGFSGPKGVAVDGSGDVFVSDGNAVYEIVAGTNGNTPGTVSSTSTVNAVGSGFSQPEGVAVDGRGNVFVADVDNNAVKEIVVGTNGRALSSSSTVNTLGSGFSGPIGVAVDGNGDVFVADYNNVAVKEIDLSDPPTLTFASTPIGSTSSDSPQSVVLLNAGNQTLSAFAPGLSIGTNFAQGVEGRLPIPCRAAFTLPAGEDCELSLSFTPTVLGPIQSTAVFTDNALNAPSSAPAMQTITLNGTGMAAAPDITFTTAASYAYGQSFQAAATSNSSSAITFSLASGPASVTNSGMVTVTGVGPVVIQANQTAEGNYTNGTQTAAFSAVQAGSTTALSGAVNTPPGNTASLVATVSPQYTGTPTGAVTFYDGATALATVPLASGSASFTTNALSGLQSFTAVYNGDANFTASPASNSVSLTLSVTAGTQTIQVLIPAPATATNKGRFTVAASASSGLPITYSSAGVCFNDGATYTMTSATTGKACYVKMSQAGNSNYQAAPTVLETTTVAAPVTPAVSVSVPSTATYESTYAVGATTNASTTPTFTVAPATVCTISGATVTMIKGTGTCVVTAKWPADDVYAAATAIGKTTAAKATAAVTWATPAPITYGTALSATQLDATSAIPGTFVYTPASGKVLTAGTQALSVKFTPTATADYATATGTVELVVTPASTTSSITTVTPSPSKVGQLVAVYFNVSPGKPTGSVTVSASSGETCSGTVTSGIGHCKLGLGTAGSITLTASYGGDANYSSSVSAGFTQTVN
ncbi:MAG: Ig-like domain repeat protein [Acidobacteriaceae bacterium]